MNIFKGIALCQIILAPVEMGGLPKPDMLSGCTWGFISKESPAECTVAFSTYGDRLAELEAHDGILSIIKYKEQDHVG